MTSGIRVWLALGVAYALLSMGYVDTTDAAASVETAIALVERGSPRLDPADVAYIDTTMVARGKHDGRFSKMGLLMPLLYLPAVVGAKAFPAGGVTERRRIDFLVSFVNSFLTAAIGALLFVFAQRSGLAVSQALVLALIAGFATLLLPYAKSAHREPVQALCLLALYGSLQPETRPRFFLAGVALGAGVLAKQAFLLPALPAVAWALWRLRQEVSPWGALIAFVFPAVALASLWPAYSYLAWETPFFTGYSPQTTSFDGAVWRTPFFEGAFSQLLSFKKGLLAYDPLSAGILVAALVALARKKTGPFEWAILASVALQVALYAKWISPVGHEALGPRYLVVVIPLLFLFFRKGLGLPSAVWPRRLALGLVLICAAYQFVHTSVKMQQFYTLQDRLGAAVPEPHWRVNLRLFVHKLTGQPERYPASFFRLVGPGDVDVTDVRSFDGLNFWWWHLWRNCPAELSSL